MTNYWRVLNSLGIKQSLPPILLSDIHFDESGRLQNGNDVVKWCFKRGLDDNSRYIIWPFLVSLYPIDSTLEERAVIDLNNLEKYDKFQNLQNLLISRQKEIYLKTLKGIHENIKSEFNIDKDRLDFVMNIIGIYLLIDRDIWNHSEYFKILLFLLDVFFIFPIDKETNEVTTKDGKKLDLKEASSFMLFFFMKLSEKDSLFLINLKENYKFFSERVRMIIENVHPGTTKFIGLKKIIDPETMHDELKAFFKKCFNKSEIVKRFFDSSLAANPDKKFFLFFTAAIILLFYVPLMIKNGGGVFDFSNDHEFYDHIDINVIIDVARKMPKKLSSLRTKNIIFEKIKDEKAFIDYEPKFMQISNE